MIEKEKVIIHGHESGRNAGCPLKNAPQSGAAALAFLLLLSVSAHPSRARAQDEVIGPEPAPIEEAVDGAGKDTTAPKYEIPAPPPAGETAAEPVEVKETPALSPEPAPDEGAAAPAVTEEKKGEPASGDASPPDEGKTKEEAAPSFEKGFRFGSYGRMGFGTTEEGRAVKSYHIANHPPRLFESNYVEVDLGYVLDAAPDRYIKVLMTTAFMANFFHYSGSPDIEMAVRNLYLEVKGYLAELLTVWAGSRMYRGDDIYLVDLWPMDNLNTIGGGVMIRPGLWDFRLHFGVNRLADSFQYQEISVAADPFEPKSVVFMDRQRFIVSAKATRYFLLRKDDWNKGVKVSLYGEYHTLPDGYLYREDIPPEKLPADHGWLIGLQGGVWGLAEDSFLNLWLRASGGLASYGEFAVPFGVNAEKKTARARDFLVGLSENFEFGVGGLLAGAYLRYFRDADPNVYDLDDYWEGVFVLRLQFYPMEMLHLALEVGESFRRTTGLASTTPEFDPESGSFTPPKHETPSVTHAALMFIFSPLGKGTLKRPQIRLIGAMQAPNTAARHLYPKEDIRAGGSSLKDNLIWYMGIQAEWWFNSSYG